MFSVVSCSILWNQYSKFEVLKSMETDTRKCNFQKQIKQTFDTCCLKIAKIMFPLERRFCIVFGLRAGHLRNFYLATTVILKSLNLDIRIRLISPQHRFTYTPTWIIHTCIHTYNQYTYKYTYIMWHQLGQKPSKLREKSSWSTHSHADTHIHTPTKIILTHRATQTDRQTDTQNSETRPHSAGQVCPILRGLFSQIPKPGHIAQDRPVPYHVASFRNSVTRPHSMEKVCPVLCGLVQDMKTQVGTNAFQVVDFRTQEELFGA